MMCFYFKVMNRTTINHVVRDLRLTFVNTKSGELNWTPPAPEPRHTISDGRSFSQWRVPLPASAADDAAAVPAPNVNVYPTEEQADALAALLQERGLSAASIGCGNGYLEGMLEAREIDVLAVDLELTIGAEDYLKMRSFCLQIVRVRPDALVRLRGDPAATALLFVWGRTLPWRSYLEAYPAVPLVVIVGDLSRDGCATEPAADALAGVDGWREVARFSVRALSPAALLVAYERC